MKRSIALLIASLASYLGAQQDAAEPKVHQGAYISYAENITVDQPVEGDVWALGTSVSVLAPVQGNVYVLGGALRIAAPITGRLIAVGTTVVLESTVEGSTRVFAAQILTTPMARLDGSVHLTGGVVDLSGRLRGPVLAHAGRLEVHGQIEELLTATAGEVDVDPEAFLGHGLTYWSRSPAVISPRATVLDRVEPHLVASEDSISGILHLWLGDSYTEMMGWIVRAMSWLYILVIGLFLLWLCPRDIQKSMLYLRRHPWSSLGAGLLFMILLPLLSILFLLTVLGIPVALTILALNVFGLYSARVIVISLLGATLMPRYWLHHRYLVFFCGIPVFMLISAIPWFGSVFGLLSMLLGVGSAILSHRQLPSHPTS